MKISYKKFSTFIINIIYIFIDKQINKVALKPFFEPENKQYNQRKCYHQS